MIVEGVRVHKSRWSVVGFKKPLNEPTAKVRYRGLLFKRLDALVYKGERVKGWIQTGKRPVFIEGERFKNDLHSNFYGRGGEDNYFNSSVKNGSIKMYDGSFPIIHSPDRLLEIFKV